MKELSLEIYIPFKRSTLIINVYVTFSCKGFEKCFKKILNATVVYHLFIEHAVKEYQIVSI